MELEDATRFSDLPYHIVHSILPYLDSTQQLFQVLVLLKSGTINRRFTSKPLFDYSKQLYDKYHKSFEEYITKKVLPSLIKRDHVSMLRALVRRWSNHKDMVWWLSLFFNYPEHYFMPPRSLPPPAEFGDAYFRDLPPLDEFGVAYFRDLVYKEVKGKVRDVVLYPIEQEREGEQIGRAALLKKVINIFVEIGMGKMEYYENDFEAFMLKDTELYYKRKASDWILKYSCPVYLLKAEECLKREKDRVNPLCHYSSSGYLHYSSEPKLLEIVQHELLTNYATKLLENKHSGFHALLRDDKVDDLSRMYRLFSKIPKGLDPVSSMFKQHVTAEDTTLVKQAEDAASNKKAEKRDLVGLQEQVFVRKVIELYVKYLPYVNDCFMNDTLFHTALKEAFEIFCNECLAGSSSAELLATFCDNIRKKGRSEKLSDEAIDTLEKVVKLLAYISDKDVFAEFDRMGSEDLHSGEDELSCIPISERSERMVLRMFSYLDCPLEYFPLRRSKSWFIYKMVPQEPLESPPDFITTALWYDKWGAAFKVDLKKKVLPYI